MRAVSLAMVGALSRGGPAGRTPWWGPGRGGVEADGRALHINDAWLSLEPERIRPGRFQGRHYLLGRLQWRYHLDVNGQEIGSDNELMTPSQHTYDEEGYRAFGALLSFLGAAAESYDYDGMDGENASLFAAIAFNLTRAAGTLASKFHAKATTATIHAQFIAVPARIARSARRLHLPER